MFLSNGFLIEFGKCASHASCESLGVVASYFSPGVSPTFVTIALLSPANYSHLSLVQNLVLYPDYGHFLFLTHIFSGCPYFMDHGSMDQHIVYTIFIV